MWLKQIRFPNTGVIFGNEELFQVEIGKGERFRAAILIGLLGFEGLLLLFIYLLLQAEYTRLIQSEVALWSVLAFMAIIILYELVFHYYHRKQIQSNKIRYGFNGYLNATFEVSLLSTLIIFIIHNSNQLIILHTPATLTYFIFIILSTLRLNFFHSVFVGILSASEYILISSVLFYNSDAMPSALFFNSRIQFLGQGLMMITVGIASGFVAGMIREKIQASLKLSKEKNEVIDLFGQQISPQIAREIIGDKTGMTGVRRKVCVMFLDMRNFTPFSEHRQPEEVVAFLNHLFEYMIEIVENQHGIINQFLGDGFMATFGAPLPDPDSCTHATKAAAEILTRTQLEIEAGHIPETRLGIGIHFGEAVTGNIGSKMRRQYSITGSVVILASRIENLTKNLNSRLLISESVYRELTVDIARSFTSLGDVRVKGSEKTINIFQHIDFAIN